MSKTSELPKTKSKKRLQQEEGMKERKFGLKPQSVQKSNLSPETESYDPAEKFCLPCGLGKVIR